MSAHLQFGPEWMRKAPIKTPSGSAPAPGEQGASSQSAPQQANVATGGTGHGATPAAGANSGSGASGPAGAAPRRATGTSTSTPASGPAPSTPSAHNVVSPGGFSFAAAASGGGAQHQQSQGGERDRTSGASGIAGIPGSDGDSLRYSKRLLSLYSTERAPAKGAAGEGQSASGPPPQLGNAPPPSGPATTATPNRKKVRLSPGHDRYSYPLVRLLTLATSFSPELQSGGVGGGSSFDRETRRGHGGTSADFASTSGPNGEPRGLNARAMNARDDKHGNQRPGLFQRGSSNAVSAAVNLSPTALQHRERERHGSGIQGGVLSGVAPGSRKGKDAGSDGGQALSPKEAEQPTERPNRGGPDAFASVGRIRQASHRSATNAGASDHGESSASRSASDHYEPLTKESWARLRRERLPGEGPLGPPSDHSGGFVRYAGLDRKRERQTNTRRQFAQPYGQAAPYSQSRDSSQAQPHFVTGSPTERRSDTLTTSQDYGPQSSIDLARQAYSLVDSLKLDDDEDIGALSADLAKAEPAPPLWSADEAEWFYKDPSGQVQGPFKANVMQDWHAAKYFTDDLLVRRDEVGHFEPLGKVIGDIGDVVTPFLIPPSHYKSNQLSTRGADVAQGHLAQALRQPSRQDSGNAATYLSGPTSWGAGLPHDYGFGGGHDVGHQSPFAAPASAFASGMGTSSPFATPPAAVAELGGGGGAGPRQQEDYLAMIRQRELAEFRAMQEQRNAHMAAMAMAHNRPDMAGMGGWNGAAGFPPSEWGMQNMLGPSHGFMQHQPQHPHQPQHQPQQPQFGPDRLQHDFQASPMMYRGLDTGPNEEARRFEQMQSHDRPVWQNVPNPVMSPQVNYEEEQYNQHQAFPEQEKRATEVEQHDEKMAPEAAHTEVQADRTLPHQAGGRPSTPPPASEPAPEVDENAPERLWPQSPSAVEFASEPPLPSEANMSLEEVASKGKRSKRDRKKRDEQAQAAEPGRTAHKEASVVPAGVNLVDEDQFRRTQASKDDRSTAHGAASMPLISDADAASSSVARAAPWAQSVAAESSGSLSLREIQEAEERRADAVKASLAERRQRMQSSTPSVPDAALPSSMSWGLASVPSTANNAGGAASSTDQGSGANGQASGPVWNANSQNAPKKTLTEIQEEEHKRTQRVRDAQAAAVVSARGAAGKGYADLAGKTQPVGPAGTTPPGWSVVGAGGKPSTPTVPASAAAAAQSAAGRSGIALLSGSGQPRSMSASSTGSGSLPVWSAASPAGKVPTSASSTAAVTPAAGNASPAATRKAGGTAGQSLSSAAGVGAGAYAPSAGFVQYCKEQLKGLSVKTDDFIEMLLSFPLDPSPDTVEIIAESVYANSSTLDGRRFAADFVAKRKLDAAGRVTNGRPLAAGRGAAVNGGQGAATSFSPSHSSGFSGSAPSAAAAGGAGSSQRMASDVLKGHGRPSAGGGSGGGESFGGFKVVKAKGGKKRP